MSISGIVKLLSRRFSGGPVMTLEPGVEAPPFSSVDHHGQKVRLEDFRGKTVVMWFFPKADTSG